jgi:hypothetical protein
MASRRLKLWVLPAILLAALAPGNAKQTFSSSQALSFGRFAAATAGTITVTPAGVRTSTGGVILLTSTPTAAKFTNTDNTPKMANAAVIITLPTDGSVVMSSGANQMSLRTFTSNPSGTGIMSGGSLQISVGATLVVNANQPRGNYSGSIPVTIQYQ